MAVSPKVVIAAQVLLCVFIIFNFIRFFSKSSDQPNNTNLDHNKIPIYIPIQNVSDDVSIIFDVKPNIIMKEHIKTRGYLEHRIAISLVVADRWHLLYRMFYSLLESDFGDTISSDNVTLFIWVNIPVMNNNMMVFLRHILTPWRVIVLSNKEGKDLSIVTPRIRIYQTLLEYERNHRQQFDYMIEIHDDMLFPPKWFTELLLAKNSKECHIGKGCGIIMPFILNTPHYGAIDLWTGTTVYELTKKYHRNKILSQCLQVHPWMTNLSMVREIGYYDEAFAPEDVDDDDFYYRVIKGGYQVIAVQNSFVYHGLTTTRRGSGNLSGHFEIFESKHNMSVYDFQNKILNHCNPMIKSLEIDPPWFTI